MLFSSPGAIFLKLGSITIRWYGVMIACGFIAATTFACKLAKRWQISEEKILNASLISFIGGIAGARLYFVLLNLDYFLYHPADIFAIWKGGGSIHGGIIGGLLAGIIYLKVNKLPILSCLDIGGVILPIGQAIGRWGNFFNSEAFGVPTTPDFPFKLYIPPESRPSGYLYADYFHPTFLYESLWDLGIFALLYFVLADKLHKYPGMTFFVYLFAYSFGRLFIEMLRLDSIMLFGMPVPMLASGMSIFIALIAIMLLSIKYKNVKS